MALRLVLALALLGAGTGAAAAQGFAEVQERACEGGELATCTVLGLIYETGAGGERNLARALELYARTCDLGISASCTRLALAQAAPTPPPAGDGFVRVGHVADAETGEPIGGVVVELPSVGIRVMADEAGRVDLGRLPRGRHRLTAGRFGYERVEGELPVPWEADFLLLLDRITVEEDATLGGIVGRVTDGGTGQGLPYVDVTLAGAAAPQRVMTGPDGRFGAAGLGPGEVEVTFELLGYGPRTTTVTVQAGATLEVSAVLSTEPIELAPIEVRVGSGYLDRSGFYRRTRLAMGTQWTRSDLDALDPASITDILIRTPGVDVAMEGGRTRAVSSRAASQLGQGTCRLRPYLDGVAVYDLDLEFVVMDDLEAIEIYQNPSTPIEYSRLVDPDGVYPCGVVLIWSRRDE